MSPQVVQTTSTSSSWRARVAMAPIIDHPGRGSSPGGRLPAPAAVAPSGGAVVHGGDDEQDHDGQEVLHRGLRPVDAGGAVRRPSRTRGGYKEKSGNGRGSTLGEHAVTMRTSRRVVEVRVPPGTVRTFEHPLQKMRAGPGTGPR